MLDPKINLLAILKSDKQYPNLVTAKYYPSKSIF